MTTSVENTSSSVEQSAIQEQTVELPENKRDREVEKQILECFSSKVWDKRVVHYSYDHRSYPLLLIHNPERKVMKPAPSIAQTSERMLISKDPLPKELEDHLCYLLTQGGHFDHYLSNPKEGEKSEFEAFDSIGFVEGKPHVRMSKKNQGKLWQLIEAAAFIAIGTSVSSYLSGQKIQIGNFNEKDLKISFLLSLATNTLSFFSSKPVYLLTKEFFYSKLHGRAAGWILGGLTAAFTHWAISSMVIPEKHRNLSQSTAIIVLSSALGAGLRQLLFKAALKMHTLIKEFQNRAALKTVQQP
ncbi:MAG TPA: hypothetical protein VHA52_00840 [Candidatus Babeliaceae bacterium]|nr:hypothetical protein [Candidatus Babeliaceae bacterium]